MAVELLSGAASLLESKAEEFRRSIKPAETLVESRANNALYTITELLENVAILLKRLSCIAEAKGSRAALAPLCTTWYVFETDGGIIALRIKPETVVKVVGGELFFHRDIYRLETAGATVKICKWSYCKSVDPRRRDEVIKNLPQILYLLRGISNAIRKTAESILLCARREASECVRV